MKLPRFLSGPTTRATRACQSMPNVTYDGQSFLINGRRLWLVGASIQYSLSAPSTWPDLIRDAKLAGFNLIDTSVPWSRHEPRPGRFDFAGPNDLRRFVTLCGEVGMRVLLRIGPNIGGAFDGGGMPSWLGDMEDVRLRESNDVFLERVSSYYHKVLGQVADLQITTQDGPAGRDGGPLLLVQVEHQWHCSNDDEGRDYLRELARFARECGITVPLLTANDLWQDVEGTIETWSGSSNLLVNLRQLRGVQSHAPRIVTLCDRSQLEIWGRKQPSGLQMTEVISRAAEVLAAGAQFIASPFHAGQQPSFSGGRLSGPEGGFVTPRTLGAAIDEAGRKTAVYSSLKKLASFASSFGHVFADLDPDYHPIGVDLSEIHGRASALGASKRVSAEVGLVPVHLRGAQGSVVLVFGSEHGPRSTTLLLENGVRMPIHLGREAVGWFILDVDLGGKAHLDYSNLMPWTLVGGSMLVLFGPESTPAYVSVDGTPIEVPVPSGDKPLIIPQKDVVVVICNERMIDRAMVHQKKLYLNVSGFDASGAPIPFDAAKVVAISISGETQSVPASSVREKARSSKLTQGAWLAWPLDAYVTGESQRFATLEGPASLNSCGAAGGYGWYRLRFKDGSSRKRLVHIPDSGDRIHLYRSERLIGVYGEGPAAKELPLDLVIAKDDSITILADHLGGFSDGADQHQRHGVYGHLLEVKQTKPASKRISADPVDPFEVRGFLWGRAQGQGSDSSQIRWPLSLAKTKPMLVTIRNCSVSGTFLLNDIPIQWFPGSAGSTNLSMMLTPDQPEGAKRGANVLRFAPDPYQDQPLERLQKAIRFYSVISTVSDGASWAFAKWEPPDPVATGWQTTHPAKGKPCWWMSTFRAPIGPIWLDLRPLSKGQVFVNGQNLGRYFVAGSDGRKVGPLEGLVVPPSWLRSDAENTLMIFDEHGFSAAKVGLRPF